MSEIEEFNTELVNAVRARATANGDFTRSAFLDEVATRLVEAEELQDWRPSYFEGRVGNRTVSVDAWSDDDLALDGSLTVIAVDYRDTEDVQTLATDAVRDAFDRAAGFVKAALAPQQSVAMEPSTPAADLCEFLRREASSIRTIRVVLFTNARTGARTRAERSAQIGDTTVELHLWDVVRLQQLHAAGGHEVVEIDVTEFVSDGLPALRADLGATDYAAYLCVVPGSVLARVYERYGSRLLEGNVRAFLSTRVAVNKGIRRTLLNQPRKFFAFNNGVTATASEVVTTVHGGLLHLTTIKDLQIVNGGQTTASLYSALVRDRADLSETFVQLKLSVLDPVVADEMIPEISRYANTQNKVAAADLFANHRIHRTLEAISRRLLAPAPAGTTLQTHWFYERARAQYTTEQSRLTPARKAQYLAQNPRHQVITKTDLAKYHNTWECLPHKVSLGAQKNFTQFAESIAKTYDRDAAAFNDRWFQHACAKALIFKATERLVSEAAWYGNAYRANIVTYAIARTVQIAASQHPRRVIDLDRVWRTQTASPAMARQLAICAEAAQAVLLAPEVEQRNVTEWAKRELCWQRVQRVEVEVDPDFLMELRAVDEERGEADDARGLGQQDQAIRNVTEVVERAQAGFWARARLWPRARFVLSPDEFRFVELAAGTGRTFVPSDHQARRLMDAAAKLTEDGLL